MDCFCENATPQHTFLCPRHSVGWQWYHGHCLISVRRVFHADSILVCVWTLWVKLSQCEWSIHSGMFCCIKTHMPNTFFFSFLFLWDPRHFLGSKAQLITEPNFWIENLTHTASAGFSSAMPTGDSSSHTFRLHGKASGMHTSSDHVMLALALQKTLKGRLESKPMTQIHSLQGL